MPIKKKKAPVEVAQQQLFTDVQQLIDTTRNSVSQTVNASLTILNWHIGKRINEEVLKNKRAVYGKQVILQLSKHLTAIYGRVFSKSALTRMYLFNEYFEDYEIVATLSQQLSWSHFIEIIPLKSELQRIFYTQLC